TASAGVMLMVQPALFNAKAMKCFLRKRTTSGLFRTASRAKVPFPQTQPRQLPVLMTMKIGFFVFAANLRASVIEYFQGIEAHGWFFKSKSGFSFWNSVKLSAVGLAFAAPVLVSAAAVRDGARAVNRPIPSTRAVSSTGVRANFNLLGN